MIITHLIGGGSEADPLTTVDASAITVPLHNRTHSTFIPMPNGDIYFGTTSLHERKYRAIDNKVELVDLQGEGFTNYPTDSWTTSAKLDLAIAYNPEDSAINFMVKGFNKVFTGDTQPFYANVDFTTGSESTPYTGISPFNLPFTVSNTFTGLDGNIYVVDRTKRTIKKYNHLNNTVTTIVGTTETGFKSCADETLGTSCSIALDSFFVTKSGRLYFIDNGVLRTIDDSKRVISLFGQNPSYGNNILAKDARFGGIADFKLGKTSPTNNKIIVADSSSYEFREVTIAGNISKLTDMTVGVVRMETDPLTGDIFAPHSGVLIRRYDRATSTWNTVIGGGTTKYYHEADSIGLTGTQLRKFSYNGKILGFINNKLYMQSYHWTSGTTHGCYVRSYDASDLYRIGAFMGEGTCSNTAMDTSLGLQSQKISGGYNVNNLQYIQDPADSIFKFFFSLSSGNSIYSATSSGNVTLYATITATMNAFAHKFDTDGGIIFYYCGSNGLLNEYKKNTGVNKVLSWLSPTFKCKSSSPTILYNSERNSIIFAYTQNSLEGIAEYDLNE